MSNTTLLHCYFFYKNSADHFLFKCIMKVRTLLRPNGSIWPNKTHSELQGSCVNMVQKANCHCVIVDHNYQSGSFCSLKDPQLRDSKWDRKVLMKPGLKMFGLHSKHRVWRCEHSSRWLFVSALALWRARDSPGWRGAG